MAAEIVQEIIRKAVVDEEFRASLITNPDEAVSDYSLTLEELEGLRKLTDEAFSHESGTLEERVSRGYMMN